MSRTYNQECILAYAFDLIGERWTFLILRELFLGPRRFGDLHAALPGIGTNLLSKRLKELEEAGLIASGDEGRSQYRMTDIGEQLRPTARALMRWSIHYFMERPEPSPAKDCIYSNDLVPDSVALAIEMFADKTRIPHTNYALHLLIDDSSYSFVHMNGEMTARRGADSPTVARIETDVATLMQTMRGELYMGDMKKRSKISGAGDVVDHFVASFTPGADVDFEVAAFIRRLKLADRAPVRKARVLA